MAGQIKGITIEFNGDTTKLSAAIKKIKSETRGLDTGMKSLNKALKLNPNNTELLIQKQTMLKQKVSATEKQLDELNNAQKQLDAAGVDKNSQEYMSLRQEIIQTEAELKSFKKQLRSVTEVKIEALGEKFKKVGSTVKNIGKGMTTYITTPIATAFAAATKVTMDFDSQMSKVKSISGATGSEFDSLRDSAIELAGRTKYTASEVGQGFEYMAMAGWKTDQMLAGIEPILNLAAAAGEELGTTSDIVTDSLTAFGLTAEDAADYVDILAAAATNTNTDVGMMGETFKFAAPVAGSLGYTARDTAVAIGLMANAGIKSSQAGTALRGGLLRLAKPTNEVSDAMEKYNISLTNSDGSMKSFRELMVDLRNNMGGLSTAEQAAGLSAIFGKNAFSGWAAIINATEKDFNNTVNAIDNCSGAAEEMKDIQLDNLKGSVDILKSSIETAAISIGDRLTPYVRKAADFVTSLVSKFNSLSDEQKDMVVKIGLIVAAVGPLLMIGGSVIGMLGKFMTNIHTFVTGIGKMREVITKLGTGFTKLFSIVSKNPWILIAAAVVAAAVIIYKNWDSIKAFCIKTWTYIKTAAGSLWNGIKNTVLKPIISMKQRISNIINTVKTLFKFGGLSAVVSAAFNAAKNRALSPLISLRDRISGIISRIKNLFGGARISFPHIKLPHFRVTAGKAPFGLGGKGVTPSISVSWYKKGGIFDSPSIIGVGEAGTEAVAPIDKLKEILGDAAGSGPSNVFNITMTVNGAEDPEAWAADFARGLKRQARMV